MKNYSATCCKSAIRSCWLAWQTNLVKQMSLKAKLRNSSLTDLQISLTRQQHAQQPGWYLCLAIKKWSWLSDLWFKSWQILLCAFDCMSNSQICKTGWMLILRLLGSSSVSNNSTLINSTPVAKLYLSHIHHYFPLCDWVRWMQRATSSFHHSLQIWSQCFDDHIAGFYLAFNGCIFMS